MTTTQLGQLIERFRNGERGALARLLSLVENERPAGRRAVGELYHDSGRAIVVGVTGPPGAGKSTLINALIAEYRERRMTVAVIAVDPTSSISGGAALGDRIRMPDVWEDEGVYVRSMATRGQLGGLSLAVNGAVHLLDAFGFDVVFVETVGVGQAEIDIATVADTTLLLQVPGLGDAVQMLKAGVLEISDIMVVNKTDNPGADDLVNDLKEMVRLGEHDGWTPPVLTTVAPTGDGAPELVDAITRHHEYLRDTERGKARRRVRAFEEVRRLIHRRIDLHLSESRGSGDVEALLDQVVERSATPGEVAERLLARSDFKDLV